MLDEWFPNHVLERSARQSYHYLIHRYLLPEFGAMAMDRIMPADIRAWVQRREAQKTGAPTIQKCKTILSAIFTTALNDQITALHPCKGVKTPAVAKKRKRIITPEQFDSIYRALPDDDARMLVETDIESGLRWGELTELRVRDLDRVRGALVVSRAVVELNPDFHPDGGRFLVKEYPKDGEHREVVLSRHVLPRLEQHLSTRSPGDLLFIDRSPVTVRRRIPVSLPDPATLGLTEPNEAGRRYNHRLRGRPLPMRSLPERDRRLPGSPPRRRKDAPRQPRTRDTDGHISRNWFRKQIWLPALAAAGLDFHVRVGDLRHAHASWLLAGGADLQVVKERLGHGSIRTTEQYLHTLYGRDDVAVNALDKIRNRGGR